MLMHDDKRVNSAVAGSKSMATASSNWVARHRAALYPSLNLGVLLAASVGALMQSTEFGLVVYVGLLFAICSTPLLLLRRFNDRYALLGIFMALYFLQFGALDLQHLLLGTDVPVVRTSFLSPVELAVLLGATLMLAGYLGGVALGIDNGGERSFRQPPAEWSKETILILGLCVWLAGTSAVIYFQLFAVPEKTARATGSAFAHMGPLLTFIVMLGNMMQPLGVLILAYGYAKFRGPLWFILILAVVCINVGVGFVIDVKRTALMGGALVIMTRTLVDNRLPRTWTVCSVVFLIMAFPVFQAYRSEITGNRGLDRLQAFQEIGKVLEITLASRDKVEQGAGGERSQTFLERSSVKDVLETLFSHVGDGGTPMLGGRSLGALPMAFVPRLLAPEKADLSVGALFPKVILKSDSDVFISISHLGELYWNFGWLGILGGMPLAGVLLGFIGAKFNLEQGTSLTRILVLLVSAQSLCIGFEGTIPVAYVLWLRCMAAIGLLHLAFARQGVATATPAVAAEETAPTELVPTVAGPALPRFRNLMR
jgi:hypothetical protein